MVALGPPEQVTDASAAVGVGTGEVAADGSVEGAVGTDVGDDCAWNVAVGDGWWVGAGEVWATGRALAPQAITVTAAIRRAASRRQVILWTETGPMPVRYALVSGGPGWPRSTDQPIMSRPL